MRSIEARLRRIPMYRLMTLTLLALVVVAFFVAAGGHFSEPFTFAGMADSLIVLVGISICGNRILGRLRKIASSDESALITALLLWFLFWPTSQVVDLLWLAGAALLANASKYAITWRGRHLFNPAAAGAFAVLVLQHVAGRELSFVATWWVARESMAPAVVIGGLLVLWRIRRLTAGAVFVGLATVLVVIGLDPNSLVDAVGTALTSFPILFAAGFMLIEPKTFPVKRPKQLAVAVIAGVLFGYPLAIYRVVDTPPDLGVFALTPELALLIANLVAFAVTVRDRTRRRRR
jgi:Na+-transporting NADH:ubiquinone oxidoreductase subunit NqrB